MKAVRHESLVANFTAAAAIARTMLDPWPSFKAVVDQRESVTEDTAIVCDAAEFFSRMDIPGHGAALLADAIDSHVSCFRFGEGFGEPSRAEQDKLVPVVFVSQPNDNDSS